jgi:surface antigen
MQKIFLLIIILLGLTACASTGSKPFAKTTGYMKHPIIDSTDFSPTLVTSAAITNAMQPADQTQLVHLISTAKPNQVVTWKNVHGNLFEFTSLNVSVDEHGWPCRQYKMRALLRGYEQDMPALTACRTDDGNWRAV